MLTTIPRQLPPLPLMLDDLGNPAPAVIARALGVSPRTVFRWMAEPDSTPRTALLALFWRTRWGVSEIDAQAVNDARAHAGMAQALRGEVERLRGELARVVRAADFGCANDFSSEPARRPMAQVLAIRPSPAAPRRLAT